MKAPVGVLLDVYKRQEQGLTVFIISWVNPDESKADLGFEAYMHQGVLAALDAIELATGAKRVAAGGYCVGGTLLASTLAYLAAKRDKRIDSVTFFATQVDFSEAGDMQIFVDKAKLAALEDAMAKTGYLDGVKMANTDVYKRQERMTPPAIRKPNAWIG